MRTICLIACSVVALTPGRGLLAQAPTTPPAVIPDSSVAEAVLAGQASANTVGTGGRFAGGLASGLILSFIGAGITYALAGSSDSTLPAPQKVQLANKPAAYQLAFQQGYTERLLSRRKSSALKGGVIGTATLVLLVVASNSSGHK